MKIVNVIGGLGNQMFQCAFAIALREVGHGEEVYIDTHHYKHPYPKVYRGNNFYHNGFEVLDIFKHTGLRIAKPSQVRKVSYYIPNYFLSRVARKFLPVKRTEYIQSYKDAYKATTSALTSDKQYFEGYWLSPANFNFCRDKIIDSFQFEPFSTQKNREFAELLKNDNSTTIHIRRGDYLNGSIVQGICTIEYYRKAIVQVRKQIKEPVFFVFSNDPKWCVENLKSEFGDSPVYFVDNNTGKESYRDMQLMSLARCNILANSSFSWWGAFLNPRTNQIVYVPKKWVNNIDDKDAYVESWIKID